MDLKSHIRDIPDFPSPGILFRDITPLIGMPDAFKYVIDNIMDHYPSDEFDCIVGIAVSYTNLRAHETQAAIVCRLLLEKKK